MKREENPENREVYQRIADLHRQLADTYTQLATGLEDQVDEPVSIDQDFIPGLEYCLGFKRRFGTTKWRTIDKSDIEEFDNELDIPTPVAAGFRAHMTIGTYKQSRGKEKPLLDVDAYRVELKDEFNTIDHRRVSPKKLEAFHRKLRRSHYVPSAHTFAALKSHITKKSNSKKKKAKR